MSEPSTKARLPYTIRPAKVEEAPVLARLCMDLVPWGRLRNLGFRFMTLVHRHMIESKYATAYVGDSDGRVVGYMTGTSDRKAFNREFLLRHGLQAALIALPRLFLPSNIKVVLKGLFHFKDQHADDPEAEMIAGAVLPEYQGAGIFRRLYDHNLMVMKRRGCTKAMIGTVDATNDRANDVYQRYGWRPVRNQSFYDDTTVTIYHIDLTDWAPRDPVELPASEPDSVKAPSSAIGSSPPLS